MTGHKKPEKKKLTQSDVDTHVKAFLQKGGKVTIIPKGETGFKKDKLVK
jgi:hypothetical protein